MNQQTAAVLASVILGSPLFGALLNATLGPRLGRRFVNWCGPLCVLVAFVASLVVLALVVGAAPDHKSTTVTLWHWISLGSGGALNVDMSVTLDPLSVLMLMVVTGVGFLIHVYSVGYMDHERDVARFFAYMNLFITSMLVLVLAADIVILIVGWALVALSSYLLIAFWYERPSAVVAGRKAFITQVIGDFGLYLAAFMILTNLRTGPGGQGDHLYTLSLPQIFAHAQSFSFGGPLIVGICCLLAVGAFAKSAQWPLHTWLPDAMEGPTPVSALIHAATMVVAGVYLIARFHPLFDRAPVAQGMVACVGMGTCLMAGVIALSQYDIKRVIAYSTMSQIGLMIYATGIGAYSAGMFHLVTHAVFKALLFMTAGNVIHAMADEQDVRRMGGLGAAMRLTELCFLSGAFALAGFVAAGMWSKEEILGFGAVNGPGAAPWLLYLVGIGVNVLTGLYIFRVWAMTFRGEAQSAAALRAHEARRVMLVPCIILAGLSLVVGVALEWPFSLGGLTVRNVSNFLGPVVLAFSGGHVAQEPGAGLAGVLFLVGLTMSVLGIGVARRVYLERRPDPDTVVSRLPRGLYQLSYHKFYWDEIYAAALYRPTVALARRLRRVVEPEVMDGWTRWVAAVVGDLGEMVRTTETGLIRTYAAYMIGAAAVFTVIIVIVAAR